MAFATVVAAQNTEEHKDVRAVKDDRKSFRMTVRRALGLVVAVAVIFAGSMDPAFAAKKKKVAASKPSISRTVSKTAKTKVKRAGTVAAAAGVAGAGAATFASYNSKLYSALLIDAATGKVLYQENADTIRHPASLTKMMTLYKIFQSLEAGKLNLHDRLYVSAEAASQSPTKLGLRAGQRIEVEDVVLGLITESANDAAVVAAEAIGGSVPQFAQMMTATARQLGMSSTVFRNASGLPDPDQVTTARDMAKLGLALQRHFPQYYNYFSTASFNYNGSEHRNHNRLMARYEGMDGIKTGYIRASGFNLVASVKRGDKRIIGVVFGGTSAASRDVQMEKLLNAAFQNALPYEDARPQVQMASAAAPAVVASAPVVQKAAAREVTSMDADIKREVARDVAQAPEPQAVPQQQQTQVAANTNDQNANSFNKLGAENRQLLSAATETAALAAPLSNAMMPSQAHAETGAAARIQPRMTAQTAVARTDSKGWGVQIGAYNDRASGQRATALVADKMPDLLGKADPRVLAVTTDTGTIYRARLVGLTERDARAACARLQSKDHPCLTLPPSGTSSAWLASAAD